MAQRRLPKLRAPKDPLDALEPEAPLRGGVEVLSMTEIREAIEAIYRIAVTVRLVPDSGPLVIP